MKSCLSAIAVGFMLFGLNPQVLHSFSLQVRSDHVNEKTSDANDEEFVFGSVKEDDPNLPRYLCIGDSISSNYSKAIIDIHAGKINAHHPPVNCRSSKSGRENVREWLGNYSEAGRQWDVISFNFGHWDHSETKANYQSNLRAIISELKKTNAKLIWVTTCPVPEGFSNSGLPNSGLPNSGFPNSRIKESEISNSEISNAEIDLDVEQSPGRKFGVVRDFLNPWAMEIINEFPEITVCDQWQYVYENRNGRYQDWWLGNDIHFSEGPAYAIGRLLAHHVLRRIGEHRPSGFFRLTAAKDSDANDLRLTKGNVAFEPPVYSETKAGKFYSESATLAALPKKWKGANRFHAGFPKNFVIKLESSIPDEQGWEYRLDELPNHLRLKAIKESRQLGFGLAYYDFEQSETNLRTRFGPGVSGDEFLADVKTSKLTDQFSGSSFKFANNNVAQYYDLYRITRDRYYSEQIVRYAEAMILLSENQSSVTEAEWPMVNAARLLLEQVRIDRGGPTDERVVLARKILANARAEISLSLADQFESSFVVSAQQTLSPFKPGTNTSWLIEKRRVPKHTAQLIEYRPWRKTIRFLATLTAYVRALEELQGIESSNEFVEEIALCRRVIAAGLELFQRENDSVSAEGDAFFFHSSLPMQDRGREARLGHPLFEGESLVNATDIANSLTYIWEAGDTFGCSAALVTGYSNSIVNQLRNATAQFGGAAYPSDRLDSPWYRAASSKTGKPSKQYAEDVLFLSPFAPDIVNAHRNWTSHRKHNEELQLLKAMSIYGERKRRLDRR
jgi:hypothetical protein